VINVTMKVNNGCLSVLPSRISRRAIVTMNGRGIDVSDRLEF
jgi:hypothetical protein